jgi:hypothetical protein
MSWHVSRNFHLRPISYKGGFIIFYQLAEHAADDIGSMLSLSYRFRPLTENDTIPNGVA